MHMSAEVEDAIRRDPDKEADVIIGISEHNDGLEAAIVRLGLEITGRESGMLYGRIRLANIRHLKDIKAIEWIELDSLQHAL